MANMVSNNLSIDAAILPDRLLELRKRHESAEAAFVRSLSTAEGRSGLAPKYYEELWHEERDARAMLAEFVAGTYADGLGWLVPVADNPTPDQQAQWREVLIADRRVKSPDSNLEAYETYLRLHVNNLHNDWRTHLWGCSGMMPDTQTITIDGDGLAYSFETKWSPPFQWVRAIADRYPDWRIRLHAVDLEEGSWRATQFWDRDKKEWLEHYQKYCVMCGGDRHEGDCPEPGPVRNDGEFFPDTFFG